MNHPIANKPPEPGMIRKPIDLHIGIALIIVAYIGAIRLSPGANPAGFSDFPTLVFCFGVVFGFHLIAHGWSKAFKGIAIAFRGTARSLEEANLALDVCEAGLQCSVLAGVLGTLLGLIIMLSNMADPSAIGPGMAVALLSLFYTTSLACLFLAGRFRSVHAIRELQQSTTPTSSDETAILATSTRSAISGPPLALFVILVAEFSLVVNW